MFDEFLNPATKIPAKQIQIVDCGAVTVGVGNTGESIPANPGLARNLFQGDPAFLPEFPFGYSLF